MPMRELFARRVALAALGLACAAQVAWIATAGLSRAEAMQAGPAVAQVNQPARASMPASAQAAVDKAPVPVLIPMEPQILNQAEVLTGNGYYSMRSRTGGLTLVIQGSPVTNVTETVAAPAVVAAAEKQARQVGGRRIFTTLNEGIRTATWVENGVAYSLDLECAKPNDTRCEAEQYVTDLIAKLTLVGGRNR